MKNILLPTDFSENSRNAIHYAMNLLKGKPSNFYFLNVQKVSEFTTDDIYTTSPKRSIYDAIINDNIQKLQNFVKGFELDYNNKSFTFHYSVDYDVFTDAVNQAVEINEIDMIIMGTNGATGAKKVLFGSNTLHVIRHVDCPVLAIPEGYVFEPLKDILFSYHYNERLNIKKLKPLLEFTEKHKASVKILEIDENPRETHHRYKPSKELKKEFSEMNCEYYFQKGIPIPMAVNSFVQLIKVQMHVTFIERKTFLKRFIFGSETSKISYETIIPLLILHR